MNKAIEYFKRYFSTKNMIYYLLFVDLVIFLLLLFFMIQNIQLLNWDQDFYAHQSDFVSTLSLSLTKTAATKVSNTPEVQSNNSTSSLTQVTSSSITFTSRSDEQLKFPIVMYHYINDEKNDYKTDPVGYNLTTPTSAFENDISNLVNSNYKSYFLKELNSFSNEDNPVVLTFDDGYKDFYTNAFPILKKYKFKSTIFIITDKVGQNGYMTWEDLSELSESGLVEIGSHSISHPDLSKTSESLQKEQLLKSKSEIETNLGIEVVSFCYPSGKYNETTLRLLPITGYKYAVTTRAGLYEKKDGVFEMKRIRADHEGLTNKNIVRQ